LCKRFAIRGYPSLRLLQTVATPNTNTGKKNHRQAEEDDSDNDGDDDDDDDDDGMVIQRRVYEFRGSRDSDTLSRFAEETWRTAPFALFPAPGTVLQKGGGGGATGALGLFLEHPGLVFAVLGAIAFLAICLWLFACATKIERRPSSSSSSSSSSQRRQGRRGQTAAASAAAASLKVSAD
jgi:hypothetical protein